MNIFKKIAIKLGFMSDDTPSNCDCCEIIINRPQITGPLFTEEDINSTIDDVKTPEIKEKVVKSTKIVRNKPIQKKNTQSKKRNSK